MARRALKRVDLEIQDNSLIKINNRKPVSKPPTDIIIYNKVLDAVHQRNPILALLLDMLGHTGLRYSDGEFLIKEDFINKDGKFKSSMVIIQRKIYSSTLTRLIKAAKNKKKEFNIKNFENQARKSAEVEIYISDGMKSIVLDALHFNRNEKFLFANKHHLSAGWPINIRNANNILRKVGEELNVENIRTHSFRKWFANQVIEAGGTPVIVRDLLGQKSLDTTTLYVSTTIQQRSEVIRKINNY
ncbi:site-specific integrase [Vibrio sp. SS-MA-C1-2]|uniref:site-specific integrase n=1 Tax=Vibrio sp. SS-MA-C1-2 TaxID=2908646 RepID=UPI001F1ACB42|nr:site-specific integrase [Vibrio sp. SS-MA-C1-2]UJF17305.1 site-specific integrase [Vibrio sp. SS-MA-C1-2]